MVEKNHHICISTNKKKKHIETTSVQRVEPIKNYHQQNQPRGHGGVGVSHQALAFW